MTLRWMRLFAVLAALAMAVAALLLPAHRLAFVLLGGEMAIFALTAHLFSQDLERLVAIRYLRRSHPPRTVRVALRVSLALLVIGTGLFFGGHDRVRILETVGAFTVFMAGLSAAFCFLLYLFSIFTAVSTLGVALGVASLVVVLAVTSGFEREFQNKVLAVNGHVIATGYGNPEPAEADQEAKDMEEKLHDLPGLMRIEKFSLSAGEVMIGKVGANLKGVDLDRGATDLQAVLVEGAIQDLGQPATCQPKAVFPGEDPGNPIEAGRMVIGVELARKLKANRGDCVSVLVPFAIGREMTPPSFPFKVVGIFHMGFNEYDSRLAYVNLQDARGLAGARQSVFGVELRFFDPMQALALTPEIERRLGPSVKVIDWKTLNANLFRALMMQKVVISIVLLIIIIVAAFNILASLYLIVRTKMREIAILGSMGARRRPILGIFLAAGATVGLAGGGLGLTLGLALCAIVKRFGYELDPRVYLIESLPVEISTVEVLAVPAVAMAICLAATLYPAVKASRLRAIDGLRFE